MCKSNPIINNKKQQKKQKKKSKKKKTHTHEYCGEKVYDIFLDLLDLFFSKSKLRYLVRVHLLKIIDNFYITLAHGLKLHCKFQI